MKTCKNLIGLIALVLLIVSCESEELVYADTDLKIELNQKAPSDVNELLFQKQPITNRTEGEDDWPDNTRTEGEDDWPDDSRTEGEDDWPDDNN